MLAYIPSPLIDKLIFTQQYEVGLHDGNYYTATAVRRIFSWGEHSREFFQLLHGISQQNLSNLHTRLAIPLSFNYCCTTAGVVK